MDGDYSFLLFLRRQTGNIKLINSFESLSLMLSLDQCLKY